MLVLSRRPGEKIIIGDDIVIEVMLIDHNRVRIGILAPKDIPIDREEIYKMRRAQAGRPLPGAPGIPADRPA